METSKTILSKVLQLCKMDLQNKMLCKDKIRINNKRVPWTNLELRYQEKAKISGLRLGELAQTLYAGTTFNSKTNNAPLIGRTKNNNNYRQLI